ncbi:MAG: hypothetical protein OXC65_15880 [Thiotrichales bacterium]|nr:hypothetical protein [Thiotrichales bacterium]
MKMLKIVALTLAGALPLLPAMATAQDDGDDGVTMIGFSKSLFFGLEGDAIEFTVTKEGPAEVQIYWATASSANSHTGSDAEPGKDFVASRGSLFFFGEDTEKTFTVQTIADGDDTEVAEVVMVGLAINPLADIQGGSVELNPFKWQAVGLIHPGF